MARLLVIEDDEALQDLVRRAAEKAGLEVVCASNGVEGLERAAADAPDIILLDVMLPLLDGRDVLKQLKANPTTRDIPVIILSARGEHYHRMAGLELGAVEYLEKPYSINILLNRIQHILWKRSNPDE